MFLTSQLDTFYPRGAHQVYLDLERAAYITRMWGDCYGYLLVATGRADVMVDPVMNVWDAAALQPVLEEAGGVYTDWSGRPTIHGGEGIGCNRLLLDQVLAITRRHIGGGLNRRRPAELFGRDPCSAPSLPVAGFLPVVIMRALAYRTMDVFLAVS